VSAPAPHRPRRSGTEAAHRSPNAEGRARLPCPSIQPLCEVPVSNFAPCLGCQRHVRLSESQCPFCGSKRLERSARGAQAPAGAKRAVLFALGTSLAAACGDDGTQVQPIYGAPVVTTSAPSPQPLYGAIPAPSASASEGAPDSAAPDAAAADAGTDGGGAPDAEAPAPSDSGFNVQPLYGAAPQPVYGAPVAR
jgi:hypothetical protein